MKAMMIQSNNQQAFVVSKLSPLRLCSFTNGGIRICSRITMLLVLCCSIVACHGRHNSLPRGMNAFVSHKTLGLIGRSANKRTPLHTATNVPSIIITQRQQPLFMSSEMRDEVDESIKRTPTARNKASEDLAPTSTGQDDTESEHENIALSLARFFQISQDEYKKPPPFQVEDTSLLFYDVFLILNLSLSISFWAVHRMSFDYIGSAVSEGSLFCLLWIVAGLYNGAFLYSAVDGHYGSTDERGGPKAAGLLGLHTFISASSLRVIVALVMAVLEHRKVGIAGEQLIPLEIAFGLLLMSSWRALHSSYTPRV